MAFHDPDSNQREHAMALKVGRQKRIQEIDGQQVEIYSGIDDEEYEGESDYEEYIDGEMDDSSDELVSPKVEKDEAIMAIGEDGQRYMVVEVINMEDEDQQVSQDSQEQHNGGMEIEELILPERKLFFDDPKGVFWGLILIFSNSISADLEHDPIHDVPSARKISGKTQTGKDMEQYFGFEVVCAMQSFFHEAFLMKFSISFFFIQRYRMKMSK